MYFFILKTYKLAENHNASHSCFFFHFSPQLNVRRQQMPHRTIYMYNLSYNDPFNKPL